MFDVIVVEDKKITREGLMRLVDWSSIGGYAAASFSGANPAIEYLAHHHVDLVVTDIAMPDGSGLDLLKYVYHNRPDCKVIMISAYEEFSYAHQALSMGASAYLLKPVDSDQLLAEARRAFDEMEARDQTRNQKSYLQWTRLADAVPGHLFDGTLPVLTPQLEELRESFSPDRAVFLYFRAHGDQRISCRRLREIANETGQPVLLFEHGPEICCIVSGALPASDAVIHVLLEQWGLSGALRLGISEPAGTLGGWPEAFRQARAAFLYSFWNDLPPKACRFSGLPIPAGQAAAVHLDYAELKKFLAAGALEAAQAHVEETLDAGRRAVCEAYAAEMDFAATLIRLYEAGGVALDDGQARALQRRLTDSPSRQALRGEMIQCLEQCFRLTAEKKAQIIRPIVKLAQEYSIKHINEPELNLKMISQRLGVSYVYLSKAFKEDFHQGYSEYIAQYRIELAKDYLLEPHARVYEVCAKVGLEPKNFHGLFKKYTGMTPKTYQAKNVHYEEDE